MSAPTCRNCGHYFEEGDEVHQVRKVSHVWDREVATDRIGLDGALAHEKCPE